VAIAAPGAKHWQALCEAMGRADLVDDARTRDVRARVTHRALVNDAIECWTRGQRKSEVVAALGGRVPCGPVNTAADLFADPHLRARGMIREVDLPGDNPPVSLAGPPIKFSATPTDIYRRAPRLDEHRSEILAQFGLDGGSG
jgi:crotonobetainyl-CoA:carnitine CoA-transferase CaiB-like acyl-CoA transferase